MKFYPRDWRGDQALRAVSIAARGLWIECLCIMHEAKPYGHLLLNGEPVEVGALARMTGIPADEVSALLSELRQAGVLSMTGKGVIFSRRMTKDHGRAQKGRKAVKKRWSQQAEKAAENGLPNRSPNRNPTTQKPEARYSVTNVTADKPPNLADRLWSDGLAFLTASGVPEAKARPMLGKWRKQADDGPLLALLAECQSRGVSDPVPWIEAAVRARANGSFRHRETEDERIQREFKEGIDRRYPVQAREEAR